MSRGIRLVVAFFAFMFAAGLQGADSLDSMTAENVSGSFATLKRSLIPEWSGVEEIEKGFQLIRDSRLGIPWDYVWDGCSARAAVAADALEKAQFWRPAKVFAFGSLSLGRSGVGAGWWYHVALVVRAAEAVFVLDPTTNSERPQSLEEWLVAIADSPLEAKLSICNTFSYGPWSMCYTSGPEEEALAEEELLQYRN